MFEIFDNQLCRSEKSVPMLLSLLQWGISINSREPSYISPEVFLTGTVDVAGFLVVVVVVALTRIVGLTNSKVIYYLNLSKKSSKTFRRCW